ncbi:MAG: baseplate J/gp47 family protein [Solirubrobacterales bacterium]
MQPPILDPRDTNEIIQEMKALVPFYTPEWRFTPDDPDAGSALMLIFAEMMQETIRRYNRVPSKNLIAYLNLLGTSALPPLAARAWLTFRSSEGTPAPVLVPTGTQVSASGAKDPVVFETIRNFMVTPATLTAGFNVNGETDRIIRLDTGLLTKAHSHGPVPLFSDEGENLQAHAVYFSHQNLFTIAGPAQIQLEIGNTLRRFKEQEICRKLANPENTEWSWSSGENWVPFDEVSAQGSRLTLTKSKSGELSPQSVGEQTGRWICCRVKNDRWQEMADVEFTDIKAKADSIVPAQSGGFPPEHLFNNDIEFNENTGYAFGEFFNLYDMFYICSTEAFSKPYATVSLSFTLHHVPNMMNDEKKQEIDWKMVLKKADLYQPEAPRTFIKRVQWEYFNGRGWVRLTGGTAAEEVFLHPAEARKTVTFTCPPDMAEAVVNSMPGRWIRARVLKIHNLYAPDAVYQSPMIENATLRYHYDEPVLLPENCLSYNNLEYRNHVLNGPEPHSEKPFFGFDRSQASVYLGFSQPPEKGPISLLFVLETRKPDEAASPMVEWEYLAKRGIGLSWRELKVHDETNGLTETGLVTFVGPPDFAVAAEFGQELAWIRLVNTDGRYDKAASTPPLIYSLFLNTTEALQQQTVDAELFTVPENQPGLSFTLTYKPVIAEAVWVDETHQITPEEKTALQLADPDSIQETFDEWGNSQQTLIRWRAVDNLYRSNPNDRHYQIDRIQGRIDFGDDKNGRIPPSNGEKNLRVDYTTGGGTRGNLPAGEIKDMFNTIAFIDSAVNHLPSSGGCDPEGLDEAVRRGPLMVRHRNRAVTTSDFEWLARQSSQNIGKVRCLPNFNLRGERETGTVTLVLYPKDGLMNHFNHLKHQVERYVLPRTAGTVAFPGAVNVIPPVFLEISVFASLVVSDPDALALAEKETLERLNAFLDPRTGGLGQSGWDIGQFPHLSSFYTLLKGISQVKYVAKIALTVIRVSGAERVEIDPNQMESIPQGLIANGSHRVAVRAE